MKKFLAFISTVLLVVIGFTLFFNNPSYEIVEDQNSLKRLSPEFAQAKLLKIRLKNGLEAFLISSPQFQESAAALCVEAGSWEDPKEYPGMAHFLEHMLFMGTKAYPKESEYQEYINQYSGYTNAYTGPNRTVYGFSINHSGLNGALDRFSHFFIDPLFLTNSIQRELQAVDQEHSKNIENDLWRNFMIVKETANPDHPYAGFSTGNSQTLSKIPQSALKKWYEDHYTAKGMHLVVFSNISIQELAKTVSHHFSSIPGHDLKKPSYPKDIFSQKQKGHIFYIKPVKDFKCLSLNWDLPQDNIAHQLSINTGEVICNLICGTNPGGLFRQLFDEGLIEGINADLGMLSSQHKCFSIDIHLTNQGIQQRQKILDKVYETLNFFKTHSIPDYLLQEKQKQQLLTYEYRNFANLFHLSFQICANLLEEKLETFPQKLVESINSPSDVQKFFQSLTPQACLYIVNGDPQMTGIEPTIREKWMNAEYAIQSIPEEQLTAWSQLKIETPYPLPQKNVYFPESLALIESSDQSDRSTDPQKIVDEPLGKCYYQLDRQYHLPKTTAIFHVLSPEINRSARSAVLLDLYEEALNENILPIKQQASLADLHLGFGQKDLAFEIVVSGFSDKVPLLLKQAFKQLKSLSNSEKQFEVYKEILLTNYQNRSKELPLKQSFDLVDPVFLENFPSFQAKYETLKEIRFEEFQNFCSELFKISYTQATFYGNLTGNDAKQIWSDLKEVLHSIPFSKELHYQDHIFKPINGPLVIHRTTQQQGNGTILMLYESPFSHEDECVHDILGSSLSDAFFTVLRTQQQTGYIANARALKVQGHLFQIFGVQSNSHTCQDLLNRFELFLEDFTRTLSERYEANRFEELKKTYIENLEKRHPSQGEKAFSIHYLAFQEKGNFNWRLQRIEAFKKLSYEIFMQKAQQFLSLDNRYRVAILTEGRLLTPPKMSYKQVDPQTVQAEGEYLKPAS